MYIIVNAAFVRIKLMMMMISVLTHSHTLFFSEIYFKFSSHVTTVVFSSLDHTPRDVLFYICVLSFLTPNSQTAEQHPVKSVTAIKVWYTRLNS